MAVDDYRGCATFDGLNSRLRRPLIFNNKKLRLLLQRGARRLTINVRSLIGIQNIHSTKSMGFVARGFIRMHEATGDAASHNMEEFAPQWLIDNQEPGYSGASWTSDFDYQIASLIRARRLAIHIKDLCLP